MTLEEYMRTVKDTPLLQSEFIPSRQHAANALWKSNEHSRHLELSHIGEPAGCAAFLESVQAQIGLEVVWGNSVFPLF